jgi:hypothetical protein
MPVENRNPAEDVEEKRTERLVVVWWTRKSRMQV